MDSMQPIEVEWRAWSVFAKKVAKIRIVRNSYSENILDELLMFKAIDKEKAVPKILAKVGLMSTMVETKNRLLSFKSGYGESTAQKTKDGKIGLVEKELFFER